MDAEHKRPLAAFVVVSTASALLLGQSLSSGSGSSDTARPAASQSVPGPTSPASSSADPASGHAVDGVTAPPTYLPVKSIGRAPMLMARGDDGLGVSTGAIHDPDDTEPPKTGGPASGPLGQEPSEAPEPTPTDVPDDDEGSTEDDGIPGPKSTPPHGPWSTGNSPTLGPGPHTPPAIPEPPNSATGTR